MGRAALRPAPTWNEERGTPGPYGPGVRIRLDRDSSLIAGPGSWHRHGTLEGCLVPGLHRR
ncbi:hypothetical protein Rumeso_02598 [Rubellimicrobium mesophilum DSM 19309]|uniref:Uncharacterized protein n=1 Tax=Rubellimicrobium mesophilum DSM 19309 TaxID=442562 RepID=A0A017HN58_9RHOB|nr:hypothetical protein Rumeso_02598 [Rubellimicrobium mesophilum DSM 19309]